MGKCALETKCVSSRAAAAPGNSHPPAALLLGAHPSQSGSSGGAGLSARHGGPHSKQLSRSSPATSGLWGVWCRADAWGSTLVPSCEAAAAALLRWGAGEVHAFLKPAQHTQPARKNLLLLRKSKPSKRPGHPQAPRPTASPSCLSQGHSHPSPCLSCPQAIGTVRGPLSVSTRAHSKQPYPPHSPLPNRL